MYVHHTHPASLLLSRTVPPREGIFKCPVAWSFLFNPISGIPALYHMFLYSEHILIVF